MATDMETNALLDFTRLQREFAQSDVERARWIYAQAAAAKDDARKYRNEGALLDVLGVVLLGLVVAALIVGRMV